MAYSTLRGFAWPNRSYRPGGVRSQPPTAITDDISTIVENAKAGRRQREQIKQDQLAEQSAKRARRMLGEKEESVEVHEFKNDQGLLFEKKFVDVA